MDGQPGSGKTGGFAQSGLGLISGQTRDRSSRRHG